METCRIDRIGLAAQDWLVPAPEKIVVTSANQESEDGREEGSRMSEHLSEEEKTRRAYSLARIDENNIRPTTGITIRLTKITLDQTSTRDSRLSRAQRPQTAGYICRQSASQILRSAYQANEVPHQTNGMPHQTNEAPHLTCRVPTGPTECLPDLQGASSDQQSAYQTNDVTLQTNIVPHQTCRVPTRPTECLPDLQSASQILQGASSDQQSAYQTNDVTLQTSRMPRKTCRVPTKPTEYLPDSHILHILQRLTAFQSWLKTLIQPYNYKPEHLITWTSQIDHQMCTCQSYHIQLCCCCDNEQHIIQEQHGHYTDIEPNSFRSGDDWPD